MPLRRSLLEACRKSRLLIEHSHLYYHGIMLTKHSPRLVLRSSSITNASALPSKVLQNQKPLLHQIQTRYQLAPTLLQARVYIICRPQHPSHGSTLSPSGSTLSGKMLWEVRAKERLRNGTAMLTTTTTMMMPTSLVTILWVRLSGGLMALSGMEPLMTKICISNSVGIALNLHVYHAPKSLIRYTFPCFLPARCRLFLKFRPRKVLLLVCC